MVEDEVVAVTIRCASLARGEQTVNRPHRNEETLRPAPRLIAKTDKTAVLIEAAIGAIFRINQDPSTANVNRAQLRVSEGLTEKNAAKLFPLHTNVDRKPSKEDDRNWVLWQLVTEDWRYQIPRDLAHAQREEAQDPWPGRRVVHTAVDEVGLAEAIPGIVERVTLKENVKRVNARSEVLDLVIFVQRPREQQAFVRARRPIFGATRWARGRHS